MNFKRIFSSLAVAGTMLVSTISSITASASGTYTVTNPYVGYYQQNSMWCWAASAETSAKHIAPSSKTQAEAVCYVKGSTDDQSGDIEDIAYAANFFMAYSNGNAHYVSYNGAKNFTFLKAQVMADKEPIIGGWEYLSSSNWNNHATVVYKVIESDDGAKGVGYYDPFSNDFHICSYNNFCNGTSSGVSWQETCYAQ